MISIIICNYILAKVDCHKMRTTKILVLGFIILGVLGCDYLPKSANWPLTKEQTHNWTVQGSHFKEGVLEVYKTHQVVAIGDYHWNNRVMAEVNNLVGSPEFLDQVKNIVVEFGNSRHQVAMDAYITGQSHDEAVLDLARRNALFFTAWMPDVYKDFFKAVRAYNLNAVKEQQVKVWLGEAPFYWENTSTHEQWQKAANLKTQGFLNTAEKAIATKKKVLMVFGAFHLINVPETVAAAQLPLATLLKRAYPNQIFTIWPITESPINQALAKLNNPSLLRTDHAFAKHVTLVDILPKSRIRLGRLSLKDASIQQLVDGLMYVGESRRLTEFPQSVLDDSAWLNEMEARLNIVGGRPLAAYKDIMENSRN